MTDSPQPHAVILAGPNGAGKSTLAPRLLVGAFEVGTFVNADVIAQGLAGFDPASAAMQAGRIMLARLDELRRARADFAFETTLSGLAHRRTLERLRADGYAIHLFYLWVPSAEFSVERVTTRVRLGGHAVPPEDVRRRYNRSIDNFREVYRWAVTDWMVYDATRANSGRLAPVALGVGDAACQILKAGDWATLVAPPARKHRR
ncbi:MAG TPA: zeta toxin family protein [Longimicrobium sp.]